MYGLLKRLDFLNKRPPFAKEMYGLLEPLPHRNHPLTDVQVDSTIRMAQDFLRTRATYDKLVRLYPHADDYIRHVTPLLARVVSFARIVNLLTAGNGSGPMASPVGLAQAGSVFYGAARALTHWVPTDTYSARFFPGIESLALNVPPQHNLPLGADLPASFITDLCECARRVPERHAPAFTRCLGQLEESKKLG